MLDGDTIGSPDYIFSLKRVLSIFNTVLFRHKPNEMNVSFRLKNNLRQGGQETRCKGGLKKKTSTLSVTHLKLYYWHCVEQTRSQSNMSLMSFWLRILTTQSIDYHHKIAFTTRLKWFKNWRNATLIKT